MKNNLDKAEYLIEKFDKTDTHPNQENDECFIIKLKSL